MIYSSSTFLSYLQAPQIQVRIRIEIYDSAWKYIAQIEQDVTSDIGQISSNNSSAIRRSMIINLDNFNGKYIFGSDKLVWLDKRFKVYIGISAFGKPFEYVPQGVFVLTSPTNANGFSGVTSSIELMDLGYLYTDRRGTLLNHLEVAAGAKITDTIKTVSNGAYPTSCLFDDVTDTVPYTMSWEPNTSRWQIMDELAQKAKCHIYFDHEGYLRLKKINLAQIQNLPSVWTFEYNGANEKFYAGSVRKMDDKNIANHIRVIGYGLTTTTPMYDLVIDETDPKWINHPYSIQKIGRIIYQHNNGNPDPVITTQDECIWRAKYELMRRAGYDEQVSITSVPHYLLEVDDVITIKDEKNGLDGRYLIESMTIPLSLQHMTIECRKQNPAISDWNFI